MNIESIIERMEYADLTAEEWFKICSGKKLSYEFIREYQDLVCWSTICKYQKLSEEFIDEFKEKVNWEFICHYQKNFRIIY